MVFNIVSDFLWLITSVPAEQAFECHVYKTLACARLHNMLHEEPSRMVKNRQQEILPTLQQAKPKTLNDTPDKNMKRHDDSPKKTRRGANPWQKLKLQRSPEQLWPNQLHQKEQ